MVLLGIQVPLAAVKGPLGFAVASLFDCMEYLLQLTLCQLDSERSRKVACLPLLEVV